MYRVPSARRKKHTIARINLVPILDAVFILIFFLLMSADFLNLFEISSDVPMVSPTPPKTNVKPLALTLKVDSKGISVMTGVPSVVRKRFGKDEKGEYELQKLHEYLVSMKKSYPKENSVIIEPVVNINYEILIDIMDSARTLKATDDDIYIKNKDGVDIKLELLFKDVVFGNILS